MPTTPTIERSVGAAVPSDFEYRTLHTGAVASAVFGVLSLIVFVAGRDSLEASLMLCPIPLVGLVLGLRSWSRIRSSPDQFTGRKFAVIGTVLSAVCLIGGLAFSGYVYATEVPDGYVRTSFEELRPDEVDLRGDRLIPADIAALDGKKVFIKGYIRPDSTRFRQNIDSFLLVRDSNQCCFGDLSTVKFFDQVAVATKGKLTVDYSPGVFRMGGILRVFPENISAGPSAPVFALEADYAK